MKGNSKWWDYENKERNEENRIKGRNECVTMDAEEKLSEPEGIVKG